MLRVLIMAAVTAAATLAAGTHERTPEQTATAEWAYQLPSRSGVPCAPSYSEVVAKVQAPPGVLMRYDTKRLTSKIVRAIRGGNGAVCPRPTKAIQGGARPDSMRFYLLDEGPFNWTEVVNCFERCAA